MPPKRIIALDVLRGFALCGILLANIQPIANAGAVVLSSSSSPAGTEWLGLLVDQRFFPIFSLLFGVGFSLLLKSASRLALLRRLLALLAIGLVHHLLWPGEILAVYALVGLVVLPSSWLPRWAVAVLGTVLIGVALVFGNGPHMLSPGLFLLGSALTRYGVIDRIDRSTRVPAVLLLILAAGAAPALWFQWFAVAGLMIAGVYVCAVLLLLRTPLRSGLQRVFAPLGKMALTNYLTATLLVLLIAFGVLGTPPDTWSTPVILLIAVGVLSLQWLWSTLWLRRYRFGPVEWLWRWATWGVRPASGAGLPPRDAEPSR